MPLIIIEVICCTGVGIHASGAHQAPRPLCDLGAGGARILPQAASMLQLCAAGQTKTISFRRNIFLSNNFGAVPAGSYLRTKNFSQDR